MSIPFDIEVDLGKPMPAPRHYAMQGDKGLRIFRLILKHNGATWVPPDGYRVEVRYTKTDGTGGAYDTLPDGSPALISAVLGTYSIAAVPQMFTAAGVVKVSIAFISGELEIATFPTVIEVIRCPGVDVKSENYENLSPYVKKSGWTGGKLLGTDETGTIVEVDGSAGGGLPAPARASVGQFFRVKTVDESGKVTAVELVQLDLGEPVACLCNGVEFPLIPERDETIYPYLLLSYNDAGFYSLRAFSCEPSAASRSNLTLVPYNGEDGQYISTVFGEGKTNSFGDPSVFKALLGSVTEGTIWTNFDLRYKGTDDIYFEKSDSVPVYGASQGGGSGLMHIVLETELTTSDIVELSESDQEKLNAASALKMPCIISYSLEGSTVTGVLQYAFMAPTTSFSSQIAPSVFITIVKVNDNTAWEGQIAVITQE